ncbi:M56 family metallopeptidase [Actinomarinicola tropica]|uniref:M48 family metalloprotease n=1 Tax=Actinomarinicola tropica TaxID=2789776 RepID=A0A5Q2RLW0_9ACTN|nr:M56 family metallopeptidase [Actinomarinicola tropica]QGG94185.1 M48 family metalloprotease [Actinomarinicola tropica]
MNLLLVAPLMLTTGGIVAGWFLPRFVAPAACARALTAAVVLAAASVGSALLLVTLAASSELHAVSDAFGWCRALYPGDHGAAPWAGAVAGGLLVAAVVRASRYRGRVRAEHAPFAKVDGLEIIESHEPIAFAVPGRPGGVVIGSTLLGHLDPDERSAVLAHENAHLTLHHHRYVHTVELCAAAFPLLIPLARQVRFATERWADETAAAALGSRRTVARAIARVALMSSNDELSPALAFSGRGTSARVDALLHPVGPRRVELPAAVVFATVMTTMAGSSVQAHHLAMFLVHACRA